jgi:hypothetical protein
MSFADLGLNALLDFRMEVTLDGETLSAADLIEQAVGTRFEGSGSFHRVVSC